MSQELSVFQQATNVIANANDETAMQTFEELVGGGYLPRLQLCTSASELCKSGQVPVNQYVMVINRTNRVLGANIDVVPVAFRATAMDTSGDDLVISHDKDSDLFKSIVDKSPIQDSGCLYGPEFLVWIPSEKCFATLYCGSKTARNMAASIFDLIAKLATLSAIKITGKKNTWYGMECQPSNAAVLNQPTLEELKEKIQAFKSDTGTVETTPSDAVAASGREV